MQAYEELQIKKLKEFELNTKQIEKRVKTNKRIGKYREILTKSFLKK